MDINYFAIDQKTKERLSALVMPIFPSFVDIRYFLEVAQTKNISRAAERLGITQPSLSSAMKRLVSATGATL